MDSTDSTYDLYQRGIALLGAGDHHAAIIALTAARNSDPEPASIREALGRALFCSQRYAAAIDEFSAVLRRTPTDDYALFCLGRCLQLLGRNAEARHPLALAACLRPERSDYRLYRDRARAAASTRGHREALGRCSDLTRLSCNPNQEP